MKNSKKILLLVIGFFTLALSLLSVYLALNIEQFPSDTDVSNVVRCDWCEDAQCPPGQGVLVFNNMCTTQGPKERAALGLGPNEDNPSAGWCCNPVYGQGPGGKNNGESCSNGSECLSGNCSGGVCAPAAAGNTCTLGSGGTNLCKPVTNWGSQRPDVWGAAKSNLGTQYMEYCPNNGAVPVLRTDSSTLNNCNCPTLNPVPGQSGVVCDGTSCCIAGNCGACNNLTVKCVADTSQPSGPLFCEEPCGPSRSDNRQCGDYFGQPTACTNLGGGHKCRLVSNPDWENCEPPRPADVSVSVTGRVYCQDEGGLAYNIPNATIRLNYNTGASTGGGSVTVTTDSQGRFTFNETSNRSAYALTVQALPSGEVTPGRLYSQMQGPIATNCSSGSLIGCSGASSFCSSNNQGYQSCTVANNSSNQNFDFRYTDCSVAQVEPVICGDAICHDFTDNPCESGFISCDPQARREYCERTAPGASTYRACTEQDTSLKRAPTGEQVANCYGINNNLPADASSCKYCGDGIRQPWEECDFREPGVANCNTNCTFIAIPQVCIDLNENGPDPIRSLAGSVVEYTLVYQHNSQTDPFPNIRLRAYANANPNTPVGRSATNPGSGDVERSNYNFDPLTNRHTYSFRWEALNVGGGTISPGTYNVRVLLDGTTGSAITTPEICLETITISQEAQLEPVFTILKQSSVFCDVNGDVVITYTVSVTNLGPVSGTVDFVRDNIDPRFISHNIIPTSITPSFGTYSSGSITWVGTVDARSFTSGQTKAYSYQIRIPSNLIGQYIDSGIYNVALAQYDTPTTNDNIASFDLRTLVTCPVYQPGIIPETAIFDDPKFLFAGLVVISIGYFAYRNKVGENVVYNFLSSTQEKLSSSAWDLITKSRLIRYDKIVEKGLDRKRKKSSNKK